MHDEYKDAVGNQNAAIPIDTDADRRLTFFQDMYNNLFPDLKFNYYQKDPESFNQIANQLMVHFIPENPEVFDLISGSDMIIFLFKIFRTQISPFTPTCIQILESIFNSPDQEIIFHILSIEDLPDIINQFIFTSDFDVIGNTLILIEKIIKVTDKLNYFCPIVLIDDQITHILQFEPMHQQLITTLTTILALTKDGNQLYAILYNSRFILKNDKELTQILHQYVVRIQQEPEIFGIINSDYFVVKFLIPLITPQNVQDDDPLLQVYLDNSLAAINFLLEIANIALDTNRLQVDDEEQEQYNKMRECLLCINWGKILKISWPEEHLIQIMKLLTYIIDTRSDLVEDIANTQICSQIPDFIQNGSFDLKLNTLKFVYKLLWKIISPHKEAIQCILDLLICEEFAQVIADSIENDQKDFRKVVIKVMDEFCKKAELTGRLNLLQIFYTEDVHDALDEIDEEHDCSFFVGEVKAAVEGAKVLWEHE